MVFVWCVSIDNPAVFSTDNQQVDHTMTKASEEKRQAKLLVNMFDDGLVVKDLLYYHIKCRLNLLVPQGLDGCLPRPKLSKSTPAYTDLQSG